MSRAAGRRAVTGLAAAALWSVQAAGQPAAAADDAARMRRLAAVLERCAARDRFSGVVLVARNGRPIFARAYGQASKDPPVPNRVDTRFFVASITKMFTGVAVAQLAEAGRLSFDDPVTRYLPELATPGAGRITVRHLLTHTSGMGTIWKPEFLAADHARYREVRDYFPLFEHDPLQFAPGARWAYSNAGYVALGAVIERVTGRRYRDYVAEHVFRRAGMTATVGSDEVDARVPNRAVPYTRAAGPGGARYASAERRGLAAMMPAGGAASTAPDLLRFATALTSHRLLGPAYTDSLTAGAVPYRPGAAYGYGVAVETVNGRRVLFHDGGADGVSANLDLIPELGYVAVVLSNYDHPAARPVVREIRALLTGPR